MIKELLNIEIKGKEIYINNIKIREPENNTQEETVKRILEYLGYKVKI